MNPMMANAAMQAAQGAISGYLGAKSAQASAQAFNRLSAASTAASNKVRVTSNAATAAQNTLARWVQSVNNNRQLQAGGESLEAGVVNYRREADSALTQSFADSISSAEQQGAAAASQAAAGVGGSVVDMVNGSVALRDSIVRQSIGTQRDQQAYDVTRRAGLIMSQMVGGLDNSVIMDTLDYTRDAAQYQTVPSTMPGIVNGILQSGAVQSAASAMQSTSAPKQARPDYSPASGSDYSGLSKPSGVRFGFTATESSRLRL